MGQVMGREGVTFLKLEAMASPRRQSNRTVRRRASLPDGDGRISSGRSPANVDYQWECVARRSVGWDEQVDLHLPGIHEAGENHIGGWGLDASEAHTHREHGARGGRA